jgi:hypothetical protein
MSGGWTAVDSITNKSIPIQGTSNSGAASPFVTPAPGVMDPVNKLRVSTPQALIDTDFEYGTQPTKWETIGLQQNRQSVYYIAQQPLAVTAVTGTSTADQITISFGSSVTIPNNTPIYIQNSTNSTINGWAYIATGGTASSFTVLLAPGSSTTTNGTQYFNPTATYVYLGYFYSNCGIAVAKNSTTAIVVTSATVITVTTQFAHGLNKGSYIYITGTTGGTNVNGAYIVATVPTQNTFTVTAAAASGTVTTSNPATTYTNTNIYARPSGYVEPRTFDGGVAFSAGGAVPNQQLIRQTRRYFRYQSGKGIQFSTGTCLKPAVFLTSITSSGTTATVTCRFQHNLAVGSRIQVVGADQGPYNGSFTIATVPSPTTFTYTMLSSAGVSPATGFGIRVSPLTWYGSSNRVGFFDQQNGMFFEYDGQTLYAVLRNSINQLNGTVSVTAGSAAVVGDSNTQFASQIAPGDFIVIRGMTYRVITITDNQNMQVSPEYRGTSDLTNCLVSKTIETRIPQSQWTDPCNGTGPSGYNIDLTRMQMWFIDYSWYGAGVIRFGIRTTNGNINYVTQIQNNNRQFEAYMRSGNMAAHYESNGVGPVTTLSASLDFSVFPPTTSTVITPTQTTILASTSLSGYFNNSGVIKIDSELIYYSAISSSSFLNCVRGFGGTKPASHSSGININVSSIDVADCSKFPPAGTVKLSQADASGFIEYIAYTGNDGSILYGLTRSQTGGQGSGISFTYSATAPVAVELVSPDTVPSLAHWGSSAIMDGQFNDDKSLIFNYGTTANLSIPAGATVPVIAIRVAPSVDNGQTGLLGNKEIINRMQLQLVELGVVTSGTLLINLILNGYCTSFSGSWTTPAIGNSYTSSLAQVASNTTTTATITGGESVAAAYTNSSGQTTLDLSQVRDLGNSILGGGNTFAVPTGQAGQYPDGPDILYVVAINGTGSAVNILSRLSWKEAQA